MLSKNHFISIIFSLYFTILIALSNVFVQHNLPLTSTYIKSSIPIICLAIFISASCDISSLNLQESLKILISYPSLLDLKIMYFTLLLLIYLIALIIKS